MVDIKKKITEISQKTGIPLIQFSYLISDDLLEEIEKAKTVEEVREAYSKTTKNSEAERKALEKWIELLLEEIEKAKTVEEVKEAYREADCYSETKRKALEK
ncbi:MAG: albumin-binding GA domain-containing protein [Candidatus Shapirobacteria bacterium]|nr:albumin-binding GA domain-containing protein [Candidatus Shapirobacteria bacterium]